MNAKDPGLIKTPAIDLYQIRSVSISRFIKRSGIFDEKSFEPALEAVAEVLDIP